MTTKDYFEIGYWVIYLVIVAITAFYIAFGPKNAAESAVIIGRRLNIEQQKDTAKRNLFLTLFALRGSPLHYDFVKSLNEIDIVFEDTQPVLDSWHTYYDSLQIKGQANAQQTWSLQRAELLSAMAFSLGYNRIKQTDIIRDYYPEGHEDRAKSDWNFRESQRQYYEKTTLMATMAIDRMIAQDENAKEIPTP